jgi:hypothetical protein
MPSTITSPICVGFELVDAWAIRTSTHDGLAELARITPHFPANFADALISSATTVICAFSAFVGMPTCENDPVAATPDPAPYQNNPSPHCQNCWTIGATTGQFVAHDVVKVATRSPLQQFAIDAVVDCFVNGVPFYIEFDGEYYNIHGFFSAHPQCGGRGVLLRNFGLDVEFLYCYARKALLILRPRPDRLPKHWDTRINPGGSIHSESRYTSLANQFNNKRLSIGNECSILRNYIVEGPTPFF